MDVIMNEKGNLSRGIGSRRADGRGSAIPNPPLVASNDML